MGRIDLKNLVFLLSKTQKEDSQDMMAWISLFITDIAKETVPVSLLESLESMLCRLPENNTDIANGLWTSFLKTEIPCWICYRFLQDFAEFSRDSGISSKHILCTCRSISRNRVYVPVFINQAGRWNHFRKWSRFLKSHQIQSSENAIWRKAITGNPDGTIFHISTI